MTYLVKAIPIAISIDTLNNNLDKNCIIGKCNKYQNFRGQIEDKQILKDMETF